MPWAHTVSALLIVLRVEEQETTTMRKVIAAFKISADGKYAGPGGYPDWVDGWPDDYGPWLTTQIDACVLGGQAMRVERMLAAEFNGACPMLTSVGLGRAYSDVCTGH